MRTSSHVTGSAFAGVEKCISALLDAPGSTKEIRTNDGRVSRVGEVECWALGVGTRVIMDGPRRDLNVLSIRNVASIGISSGPALSAPA